MTERVFAISTSATGGAAALVQRGPNGPWPVNTWTWIDGLDAHKIGGLLASLASACHMETSHALDGSLSLQPADTYGLSAVPGTHMDHAIAMACERLGYAVQADGTLTLDGAPVAPAGAREGSA